MQMKVCVINSSGQLQKDVSQAGHGRGSSPGGRWAEGWEGYSRGLEYHEGGSVERPLWVRATSLAVLARWHGDLGGENGEEAGKDGCGLAAKALCAIVATIRAL